MRTENLLLKLKLTFVPCEANNFRPTFLTSRVLIWCLVVLFCLKLIIVPFLICFPKTGLFSDVSKALLIELLNEERESSGLEPLKENQVLNTAAVLKADDMLNKDYFAHTSPDGLSPWYFFQQAGYNYNMAGENLAIGFLDSSEVQQAWLDSPSHKANLLNENYKEVGIAVLRGDFQSADTTVVVQLFATPKPEEKKESPKSASAPKVQTKEKEVVEEKEVKGEAEQKSVKETLSAEFTSFTDKVVPVLKETQEKATFNFLSFFSSDFYKILQVVIYGFLALVITALIINIFVRPDIQHFDLILKAFGFIIVLIAFILIDKSDIIKLIPHSFGIY